MDKEKWEKRQRNLATEAKLKREAFLKKQAAEKKKAEQHELDRTTGEAPKPSPKIRLGPQMASMDPAVVRNLEKVKKNA